LETLFYKFFMLDSSGVFSDTFGAASPTMLMEHYSVLAEKLAIEKRRKKGTAA
jgi:hypothetical protein